MFVYRAIFILSQGERFAGPAHDRSGISRSPLGLVEQGLGIAVAPRTLANRSGIKIIPLTPLRAKRWVNVYLVSNRIGWNSTAQGFVEHCGKRFIAEQRAAGDARGMSGDR